MKHPNVLKYIDGVETSDEIRVVTEDAIPLKVALQEDTKQFFMKYGLLQLLRGIDFLSNKCGIVHGNIGIGSVFVDSASEWKLAGLEYSHAAGEPPPPKPASLSKYDPPEAAKGGSKKTPVYSTDMWGLGVLIYEVYNGELQHTSDLRNTRKIPKDLVPHYCTLVSANPNSRPNPKDLLEEMRAHGGYLSDPMISIAVGAEELHVMEATQRKNFLDDLNKRIASFPKSFCTEKLLTCLLNTFEFSNAGTTILEPLFKVFDTASIPSPYVHCFCG
jgi:SCY1-like protein 1